MFKRIFGIGKEGNDIDRSLGYKRYTEFSNYLEQLEFQKFDEKYVELNADEKSLLSEGIGLNKQFDNIIHNWVSENEESHVANLFAGISRTRKAWEARTAALGKDVSQKRAELFYEYLDNAYSYLQKSDEINPEEPEVCARMIRVCMGLGVEEIPTYSYFNASKQLDSDHLFTHLMMANYLNPKWRGSIEKMHEFADKNFIGGSDNLLIVLKLFAITEEWNYYKIIGETKKNSEFFKDPDLKKKVLGMHSAFQDFSNESLLAPIVRNYFAFLLYKLNEKDKVKIELTKIAGKMTEYPWAYIGINTNKQLQKIY